MTKSEILKVSSEKAPDGTTVVSLQGELDLSSISKLEPRLLEAAGAGEPMVLDLTRLSFVDSSGIAILIRTHRAGRVSMAVSEGSQVERVLQLAGIDRELSVFGDRDEALAAAR